MSRDLMTLFGWGHLILYLLCFFLLSRPLKKQNWFQNLGKRLVTSKEKQLKTNPLLKTFSRSIDQKRIGTARIIIASLIFLKSVGMVFIGVIGMTVILIPVQAVMMASMSEQIRHKGISDDGLSRVTGFQLATMIIGTTIGNLIGWRLFIDNLTFRTTLDEEFYALSIMTLGMLIFTWLTARREVEFYQVNRRLIG